MLSPTRPKLLLVDDDTQVAYTIKRILRDCANLITVCLTPNDAIKELKNNRFDLMVVDLKMEGMDGVAVIKEAKKHQPELVPILLTGYPDMDSAISAFKVGAYDFLIKPIQPHLLQAVVSRGWEKLVLHRQKNRLFTELQTTNEILRKTQAQLVQAAKLAALGEMSAGVAHELNNPLLVVKGFNERVEYKLKKDHPQAYEATKKYLQDMNEGADRMKTIISNMQEFSRSSDHKCQPTNINDVIDKSFLLLKEQLHLHEIRVEKNLTGTNPIINADANRLEQVFFNIIANAKDALETSKNKQLRVATTVENGNVLMSFSDNGTGIEQTIQGKIFDPFFTTKDVGKGTGLGLSISYGIIKEHQGTITVTSVPGKGTTFLIQLPMQEKGYL